ncbi:MAG: hypothetical protein COB54_03845 [Alphaproteobacteria bacterium]|nr:MAG: hypothetical protein COB54_03845 [Alphaproteobacteria bacterium]
MENENFASLPKKKLKKLIHETQDVLDQLKAELKTRKQDKQHDEIDHMEEHFEDAAHNLSNLKNFIQKAFSELRKDK